MKGSQDLRRFDVLAETENLPTMYARFLSTGQAKQVDFHSMYFRLWFPVSIDQDLFLGNGDLMRSPYLTVQCCSFCR